MLSVGGRRNLNPVRVIQSTEYAHEQRYARRPGRAGGFCGRCYNGFGSCFPVRDAGRVAGNAGNYDPARRLADGGFALALSPAEEGSRICDPRDSFVLIILR